MKYLFKCKTSEAYNIKILSELLSYNIKTGCFEITENGIFLRMFDYHRKTLIDLELKAEKFVKYIYNSPNPKISVGVNLNHFFKMLRSIKKKDSLELYILQDQQHELIITSIPRENTRKTMSNIKIQSVQNIEIEVPSGYDKSILVNSCDFQKMCKDLNSIGSLNIDVFSKLGYIEFTANADDILKRSVCFGHDDDEDYEHNKTSVDVTNYKSTFSMEHFFRINKITGLSSNIQIYASSVDLPIFFKVDVGQLGSLSIYLKSKEMIESESVNYIDE